MGISPSDVPLPLFWRAQDNTVNNTCVTACAVLALHYRTAATTSRKTKSVFVQGDALHQSKTVLLRNHQVEKWTPPFFFFFWFYFKPMWSVNCRPGLVPAVYTVFIQHTFMDVYIHKHIYVHTYIYLLHVYIHIVHIHTYICYIVCTYKVKAKFIWGHFKSLKV